jgi:hypothetical protein
MVLAIGHTLRAHEALSCPDAPPGFLEVVQHPKPADDFGPV